MTKRWQLKRRDYDAACSCRKEFWALLLALRHRSTNLASPELVFGELVVNAVRYGDEPISVDVALSDDGTIQIRVENAGNCFNLQRLLAAPTPAAAMGGRGLKIVHALVDTLTVEHQPPNSCRVTAVLKI